MACVVAAVNRPALVMAPNKTLAAQLYSEFKSLFPSNAVEYFVSYYDYYQPEAYIPSSDTYIEKDSSINDEIDKLRHSATHSLLTRRDVLVVASVSCIYGLGSPQAYGSMHAFLEVGQRLDRDRLLRQLVDMLYTRNDHDFQRGTFRVRGDVVEVIPQYESERAVRIEFFGDEIEAIAEIDPLRGKVLTRPKRAMIYPASHYVSTRGAHPRGLRRHSRRAGRAARSAPRREQAARGAAPRAAHAVRRREPRGARASAPASRTTRAGSTAARPGSRRTRSTTTSRRTGSSSSTRATSPCRRSAGMYRGDRARKETLVEYGFRLPSALDNRPLRFEEWEGRAHTRIYVSATPGDYELERCRRRGGRADHPADRARGSEDRGAAGVGPGGRPARRDPLARRGGRAGTRHHAHQAHGRGAHRVLRRPRRARALPPQRHPDHRAHRDHPRAPRGRLRRAGRHQPAARGPRHSGGVAGGDPRRRQGRLPALHALADPDDRARGAERERHRDPLRRQADRLDPRERSPRRSAGASSRSATTRRTASRRRR